MGESGCGKSTLVNLILRFYDPDLGSVLVDGVNVKDYDLKSLRLKMGLVQQEPILFNYTIKENILYGLHDAKNSDILEAAKIANAMEFIEGTAEDEEIIAAEAKEDKITATELLGELKNKQ